MIALPPGEKRVVYASEGLRLGFLEMSIKEGCLFAGQRKNKQEEIRISFDPIGQAVFLANAMTTMEFNQPVDFPKVARDTGNKGNWYLLELGNIPEQVTKNVTGRAEWKTLHEGLEYTGSVPLAPPQVVLLETGMIESTPTLDKVAKEVQTILGNCTFSRPTVTCGSEYDANSYPMQRICPRCDLFNTYLYTSQQGSSGNGDGTFLNFQMHWLCFACKARGNVDLQMK